MELWKDWYLLERENRNRDGEWLEIAQRKAARAEGKPVTKMTAEQWQRLYGQPIPVKGSVHPPQSTPMPVATDDLPPWDE